MNVPVTSGGGAWGPISGPNLQTVDGTGLLVGPLEEGVGFIDTTAMRKGAVGSQFPNGYLNPATGSTSGGTEVQITEPASFGTVSAVYFGSKGATNVSGVSGPNTYGNFGSISATAPSGTAGPVDVFAFTVDGGMQLVPEGFSYGPTIVEITPDMSTAEGGRTGVIFGYGFGPVGSGVSGPLPQSTNSTSSGIPSSLQVKVAGNPVQVTGFAPYAYPSQSPPFPLQAVAYTIPSGAATEDVTVTSSSGTATAHSALTYLPPLQQFPLPGAALAQGIYDRYRDVYYFTDANKVQVFSKTQGKSLSPISIPAPHGATQRLWGIAMSPDGSKLAVSDAMAGVIYILDPTSPGSVKTFAVNTNNVGPVDPCGVAISDAGIVYYAVFWQGISGANGFFKLDTNTGKITGYGIAGPGLATDPYLRAIISSDNSRVFFNDDGFVFYINTATDKWVPASLDQTCCYGDYELALSANQVRFEASSYFYDSNLNAESYYSLNDREILTTAYVYGAKLSPDGTLLFQPSTNGIDVLDGRLGNLLQRISLPVALSQNYDALVVDGRDNVLVAITGTNGNGISVVDLTSIKEPLPLPYASGSSHAADFVRRANRSHLSSKMADRPNTGAVPAPAARRIIPHVTQPVSQSSK